MSRARVRRDLLLAAPMVAAAIAVPRLRPTLQVSIEAARIDLAELVPAAFDRWRPDPRLAPIEPSPDLKAMLDRLYSATLARAYVDDEGGRVMLSIAYGRDQGRALQVHKPESCYAGQGFAVSRVEKTTLALSGGEIRSMRLLAERGPRVEPVAYWIRIGGAIVRGWLEQNAWRLRFGLAGSIPDGMLVRVSSLRPDLDAAYALQARFLDDLLRTITPEARRLLVADAWSG